MYLMHCSSMKRSAKIKLNVFLKFLSSDQRSISNSKEKMNVNDKAKEKRVER